VQGASSSFSQSIDFSTGTYSLTFQAAQRAVNGGETFKVLVDGQVVGTFHPGGASYSTFTTNNFALSAGSHTIQFLGAGSPGSKATALIDNLSLNTIQTADHLVFTQQPSDTVAGQSVSPAVTVAIVDQFGNVLSYDNTDTVTVAIGANPSGGTLSGTLTVTVNGGVATFGDLSIDKAGSGYTLVASSSGLTGATSNSFAVNPATADHLVFLQQPTDTTAGQTISAVIVEVVDQFGNVVTSDNSDTVTVAIGNNPSGGTLSGSLTVTVVNGIATFGDLSIDSVGQGYTLHASIGGGGLPDVDSNPFNVTI
jgi:S-adenosylmethionine hydrolase